MVMPSLSDVSNNGAVRPRSGKRKIIYLLGSDQGSYEKKKSSKKKRES